MGAAWHLAAGSKFHDFVYRLLAVTAKLYCYKHVPGHMQSGAAAPSRQRYCWSAQNAAVLRSPNNNRRPADISRMAGSEATCEARQAIPIAFPLRSDPTLPAPAPRAPERAPRRVFRPQSSPRQPPRIAAAVPQLTKLCSGDLGGLPCSLARFPVPIIRDQRLHQRHAICILFLDI